MSGRVILWDSSPFIEYVGYLKPILSFVAVASYFQLRPNTFAYNSRMLHGMRFFKGDG